MCFTTEQGDVLKIQQSVLLYIRVEICQLFEILIRRSIYDDTLTEEFWRVTVPGQGILKSSVMTKNLGTREHSDLSQASEITQTKLCAAHLLQVAECVLEF